MDAKQVKFRRLILHPEPLDGLKPHRMCAAVFVVHRSDRVGVNFNQPARRSQSLQNGIISKIFKRHVRSTLWRFVKFRRLVFLPPLLKARHLYAQSDVCVHGASRPFVKFFDPIHLRFAAVRINLGKSVGVGLAKIGKNLIIVLRAVLLGDDLLHRDYMHIGVVSAHRDVVALILRRGRKHDVRHLRSRRPVNFIHYDSARLAPSLDIGVGVLMMHDRISADPVDEVNLRIGDLCAVRVNRLARI